MKQQSFDFAQCAAFIIRRRKGIKVHRCLYRAKYGKFCGHHKKHHFPKDEK